MIEIVINIVIFLIVYGGTYLYARHEIRKTETLFERLILIFMCILIVIIHAIFMIDYYNLPTRLGYGDKVNLNNWLNCIFVVIGSLAGGFLTMIMTRWQIDISEQKSIKRDKEENRIKNMPLLKYDFLDYCKSNDFEEFIMIPKYTNGAYFNIILKIENIGLAPIRNMYIKTYGNNIEHNTHYFDNNGILQVGESKYIVIRTQLPKGKQKVNIEVVYQDILTNMYSQLIEFDLNVIDEVRIEEKCYSKKINNEKLLKQN